MNQLESALVLVLRDTIKWESALISPVSTVGQDNALSHASGTLAPVNPDLAFDPTVYALRDRQLAYRDLILGASVIEVAIQTGDIWNYAADRMNLEGPVIPYLPFNGTEAGKVDSTVRHVTGVSIPYDAARYADADLYGRDSLIYEVLARACQQTLVNPPITPVDSTGTVIPSTSAWSLADGSPNPADINPALPLNTSLFKNPDTNLADRDNQVAAYAAKLAQILKNPFAHALRLYVQFTDGGNVAREPDVFALVLDDGVNRIFQAEPSISSANQIVYNIAANTLQWKSTDVTTVHVPQLYAMAIEGLAIDQQVQTLAQVPDNKDAQYWRSKAGQLAPTGIEVTPTGLNMPYTTNATTVIGGVMQRDSVSITAPDNITFLMSGPLPSGNCSFSALIKPDSTVDIAGINNQSSTSGTLNGATYDIDVSVISNKQYVVIGGGGIDYNGNYYAAGVSFTGSTAWPVYSQHKATSPSRVRQYAVDYYLSLPVGSWTVSIEYTNLAGSSTGYRIQANAIPADGAVVPVIQDSSLLPFNGANGKLFTTAPAGLDITTATPFHLPIYWTGGDGRLHIRRILFNTTATSGHYTFTGSFQGTTAVADVIGVDGVPGVARWSFLNDQPGADKAYQFTLSCTGNFQLPVKIEQLNVKSVDAFVETPFGDGFQGWRQDCLDRAERIVAQNYQAAVKAYGTSCPSFRESGTYWSQEATENWMSFVETYNPRVREIANVQSEIIVPGRQYKIAGFSGSYNGVTYTQDMKFYGLETVVNGTATFAGTYGGDALDQVGAFVKSTPGDLGRPALVPRGLYFDGTEKVAKAYFDTNESTPVVMACQPWMIEQGIYVANSDFWMSPYLGAPPAPASRAFLVDFIGVPLFGYVPMTVQFQNETVVSSAATFEWDFGD